MIRYLLALVALVFSTPAMADQIRIVGGAAAPTITVKYGDTLVTNKALVENNAADGTITRRYAAGWIDRTRASGDNLFQIDGASKLKLAGFVTGEGYVYSLLDAVAPPAVPKTVIGVNLSGCTFVAGGSLCPTTADIDAYAAKGFKLIRFPFSDRNLTNATEQAAAVRLVNHAQSLGLQVIIDRHDYNRHSAADAYAFWAPIVPLFSPDTMIELANEPVYNYPTGSNPWMVSAQDTKETVTLFRANGITNPILYGSPGWSATFRFIKFKGLQYPAEGMGDAIDRVGGIIDPLNKTFFSGHRYLDSGAQGQAANCVDTDAGITAWADGMRKRGIKGYLTEFAFGRHTGIPASCAAVGDGMLAAIQANSDVILGTTVWGGGRAWKEDYIYKIEPLKGTFATAPNSEYLNKILGG